jgi:hypothetical protein
VIILEHVPVRVVHTSISAATLAVVGAIVTTIGLVVVVVREVSTVVLIVVVGAAVVLSIDISGIVYVVTMAIAVEEVLLSSVLTVIRAIGRVLLSRQNTILTFSTRISTVEPNTDTLPGLVLHRVVGTFDAVLWRGSSTAIPVEALGRAASAIAHSTRAAVITAEQLIARTVSVLISMRIADTCLALGSAWATTALTFRVTLIEVGVAVFIVDRTVIATPAVVTDAGAVFVERCVLAAVNTVSCGWSVAATRTTA